MLTYSRVKSIGVQVQGEDLRVVSGVLEDELYAMECELVINWPKLAIESVQTRMKRFTTKRCPLAQKVFSRAEGWTLDADLDGKIKKEIGRYGCRHMAVLMVDCCRSVAVAELARELGATLDKEPGLDRKRFLEQFYDRHPSLVDYLRLQ
ncbi:MAG: DUF2889 domain-containing protein [Desulfomonile tiedjei]|nr:DUF2889 domain-containing protein [Desulfomonile tiedjei]